MRSYKSLRRADYTQNPSAVRFFYAAVDNKGRIKYACFLEPRLSAMVSMAIPITQDSEPFGYKRGGNPLSFPVIHA